MCATECVVFCCARAWCKHATIRSRKSHNAGLHRRGLLLRILEPRTDDSLLCLGASFEGDLDLRAGITAINISSLACTRAHILAPAVSCRCSREVCGISKQCAISSTVCSEAAPVLLKRIACFQTTHPHVLTVLRCHAIVRATSLSTNYSGGE